MTCISVLLFKYDMHFRVGNERVKVPVYVVV